MVKTHIRSESAINRESISYKAAKQKVLNWTSKGR